MKTGVLFIGHGTRRQHGIDEFTSFVAQVMDAKDADERRFAWGYAFLELATPDIVRGVETLVESGVQQILCVPLFLFSAGHIQKDIPEQLEHAAKRWPDISFEMTEPVGSSAVLVNIAVQRIHEALQHGGLKSKENSSFSVVLTGRGNRDSDAQHEFRLVAKHVQANLVDSRVPTVETGFLAGSGETMEGALDTLYDQGVRSVVVAPFLWFSGWLTDTLPDRLGAWQQAHPEADIVITSHLGLHPSFIELVSNNLDNALRGFVEN